MDHAIVTSRWFLIFVAASIAAEWGPPPVAGAEANRTALAGESLRGEIFGTPIFVPKRDRRTLTALNGGIQWTPQGPSMLEVLPFGAVYVWRNRDEEARRFRGTFSGVVNDVRYNVGIGSARGWEFVITADTFILPFGRSEYVEGQRIESVEVAWNYARAGLGLAYRLPIAPGHQDNAMELSLTYEPGYFWFHGTQGASSRFVVPTDTYEGRVRLRLRTDALDRNLMELPHRGYAFGGDLFQGHRARWSPWGGPVFDTSDFAQARTYLAGSAYALAAGGIPFVPSERHRLVASWYGGIGRHLDRFSSFRLPGRPTGYEWEALSRPVMPGVAFYELFPRRYAIMNLMYRYEALFFLYPYVRGTWAIVDRPRFADDGGVVFRMDHLPAVSAGVVSGAPWRSQVELSTSYNFGVLRDRGGPSRGGHGFFVFWSKQVG